MKVVTEDQLRFYRDHGYVHLRGVLPAELIELSKRVLARWVDSKVDQWIEEGRLEERGEDLPFGRRLMVLWEKAGKPKYVRSPRAEIVSCETWEILRHPAVVDIAEDLIGTPELSCHSVFNARPKLPNQRWTDTPWHQDAQYTGISPHHHVPSFWFPMQRVTKQNSCLGVQADYHEGKLFEPHEDEDTGFRGISPEDRKQLVSTPVEMEAGDLLCFTSLTPHHAYTNESDAARFSLDIRYEATEAVDPDGEGRGFIVRSLADPSTEESCEAWLAKGWEGRAY